MLKRVARLTIDERNDIDSNIVQEIEKAGFEVIMDRQNSISQEYIVAINTDKSSKDQ